ncbi:ferric reductase transmembrane component 3 [Dendryphion nanum]|uniref:Ferric reductase transmembrane component 3 n=1 Tax=Dendryphion nanum TaxID=256645 RepID=A0A9P9D0S1_9PLEO|nr:ferric reductase transmembrane component 3 [Dendryphion nanum]
MDITQWYAVSLGCLVGLPIIGRLFFSITIVRTYGTFYLRKHITYPQIHRYLRRSGNALCLAINVKGVPEFIKRSGLISIINIMPLSLGANMNLIVSRCGISLPTYAKLHQWLGRVAIVEGLIHVAVAVSYRRLNLHTLSDVAALTAGATFLVILCSKLLRSRVYEAFSNLHLIFAAVAIGAIYIHIPSREQLKPPVVYLIAAVSLQVFVAAVRFGQVLYRNVRYRKPLNRVSIRAITFKRPYERDIPVSDGVQVHVRLSRPWKPEAGQYAYLCIPGQRGFTKNLLLHTGNGFDDGSGMSAVIEGPYGKELKLDSYGTVLLFATGIGIAGQLPYVEKLLEGYRNCEVKTRRIALFWEVESELQTAWVADRMQHLLKEQDSGRILDIRLFVRGKFLSSETRRGNYEQIGERIDITYDALDGENVKAEMKGRKGLTMVSLCTNDETGDKIREAVRGMLDETIHLKELDFRPTSDEKVSALKSMFKRRKGSVGSV